MINLDRIIPVQKMDLLSLIGTVLALIGTTFTVLKHATIDGAFTMASAGTVLCDQPVKSFDFASGVSSGTVYFVPDYDYAGFTVAGAAATIASGSVEVNTDACNLYKAVLASGSVTITAVTPIAQ